jgi:hypothetical protein
MGVCAFGGKARQMVATGLSLSCNYDSRQRPKLCPCAADERLRMLLLSAPGAVVGMTIDAIGNAITITVPAAAALLPASVVFNIARCAIAVTTAFTYPFAAGPDVAVVAIFPVTRRPHMPATRRRNSLNTRRRWGDLHIDLRFCHLRYHQCADGETRQHGGRQTGAQGLPAPGAVCGDADFRSWVCWHGVPGFLL